MDEADLPLADPMIEEAVCEMVGEGLSSEEYAARRAHTIFCFSLDKFRYRDPNAEAWIHRLGDILFRRPGAPRLEELRSRFLTAEERSAIRKEEQEYDAIV